MVYRRARRGRGRKMRRTFRGRRFMRKSYRRRGFRRGRRMGKKSIRRNLRTVGGVISDSRTVLCKYVDVCGVFTYGVGFGAVLDWLPQCIWRTNNAYDPKNAASGTFNVSSSGYRFWAGMYNNCKVVSSSITVVVRQQGAVANYEPIAIVLSLDDTASKALSSTNWEQYTQDSRSVVGTLYPNTQCDAKLVLKKRFSLKDLGKGAAGSDSWSSVYATPPQQMFYMVGAQNRDHTLNASVGVGFTVNAYITYKVIFTDRRDFDAVPLVAASMTQG